MPKTPVNFQSPYDATSLITFLRDPVTLAFAWKLTPTANSVLTSAIAATTHTKDLTLPGHGATVFRSAGGLNQASAIDEEAGQEGAGLEFEAIFDDTTITQAQVAAGDWDGAKLEIFSFNYKVPNMGQLIEFSGNLGAITEEGQTFKAEARQLTSIARIKIGRLASANCDVKVFGDARCKKVLTAITRTGQAITSVPDTQNTFRASAMSTPTVAYTNGLVTFTSGLNSGRTFEVKAFNNGSSQKEIVFHLDTPYAMAIGDQFTIIEGCDRTLAQCILHANAINFRGLPYITNVEEFNRIDRAA
jgi:uncharacterized phage protein (TIGR02218 family)